MTAPSLLVWRLAQRSVGLNGRTLRKLPLIAHAFYIDATKYPVNIPVRWSGAVSGSCEDKENFSVPQPAVGNNGKRFSTPAVPLNVFIEALQRAADSRFSDQQLIAQSADESVNGGREKASAPVGDALNTTSSVKVNLP